MIKQARIESPIGFLTSGKLKIIACISMFLDHFGLMIFPSVYAYRAIGRLAFPIFAYFIAEGCHYSKRKVRRFLLLLGSGLAYLLFFYVFAGELYASIFLTFAGSVLIIYALDFAKKYAFSEFSPEKPFVLALYVSAVIANAYIVCQIIDFDYGFFGMMTPVLISLFDFKDIKVPKHLAFLDSYYIRLVMLTVGLCLVYLKPFTIYLTDIDLYLLEWGLLANIFGIDIPHFVFAFFAPLILLLYNGKVGNKKLKYVFYLFYPLHLVLIAAINILILIFGK